MSTVHTWHTISSRCRGAVYIEQAFVWGYPLHRINIQWQLLKTITSECIQLFYTPSPPPLTKLGGRYIEITVSVCPSLSVFPDFCGWHLLNRSSVCNQTWLIRTHQKEMVLNCRMAVERVWCLVCACWLADRDMPLKSRRHINCICKGYIFSSFLLG